MTSSSDGGSSGILSSLDGSSVSPSGEECDDDVEDDVDDDVDDDSLLLTGSGPSIRSSDNPTSPNVAGSTDVSISVSMVMLVEEGISDGSNEGGGGGDGRSQDVSPVVE